MELSVVIPAFNEATTVAAVVLDHRAVCSRLTNDFEILVCDDGSSDATWDVLQHCRARAPELDVLRNEANLGIALTMRRLFHSASGEWWYFAPADGQVPAEALERMWRVRDGTAVVVGRRHPRRDPRSRVAMAKAYSLLLRGLYRLPVSDIDSVKLYRASELMQVGIESDTDFFQAEVLIALRRTGRVLREIDVPHRPRIAGRALGVTPVSASRSIRDFASFIIRDAGLRRR